MDTPTAIVRKYPLPTTEHDQEHIHSNEHTHPNEHTHLNEHAHLTGHTRSRKSSQHELIEDVGDVGEVEEVEEVAEVEVDVRDSPDSEPHPATATTTATTSPQTHKTGTTSDDRALATEVEEVKYLVADEVPKLLQLYHATQKRYMLDELMGGERYYVSGPLTIITNSIFRTISVFRLNVATDYTHPWDDALTPHTQFNEYADISWGRTLFLGFCNVIAIPYAWYVRLVPGLAGNGEFNVFFQIFMTVINSTPFAVWVVNMFTVIRRKNATTRMKLKLLKLSRTVASRIKEGKEGKNGREGKDGMEGKEEKDGKDKGTEKEIDVNYELNEKEHEMLNGMVEEAKSLEVLKINGHLSTGIRHRLQANQKLWHSYMVIAIILTLMLCSVYGVWIGMYVFDETCNAGSGGTCTLFVVLFLTSFVRFPIPLFIAFNLAIECVISKQKVEIFDRMHKGLINTKNVCALLMYNIRDRMEMASSWQYVFIPKIVIPLLSILMMFMATLIQPDVIERDWFFLVLCCWYTSIGMFGFMNAASVSNSGFDITTTLYGRRGAEQVTFENPPEVVDAYFKYLEKRADGFKVLNVPITNGLLNTIFVSFTGILIWLSEHM